MAILNPNLSLIPLNRFFNESSVLAYWPLGFNNNGRSDRSFNQRTLGLSGTPKASHVLSRYPCRLFDATAYYTAGSGSGNILFYNDKFTIMFWIMRTPGAPAALKYLMEHNPVNAAPSTYFAANLSAAGALGFGWYNGAWPGLFTGTLSVNRLYHIAFTYDSTGTHNRLFLDGVQVAYMASSHGYYGSSSWATSLGANGNPPNLSTYGFYGKVFEVGIYREPISPERIKRYYDLVTGKHRLYPSHFPTDAALPPSAPVNVAALPGDQKNTLSWTWSA